MSVAPQAPAPAQASRLGVAQRWRRLARAWRPPVLVLLTPGLGAAPADSAWPVPAHDAALLAWRAWCSENAGQRCRLALSCRWVMSGVVPLAEAATPLDALARVAAQWDHYVNLDAAQLAAHGLVRTARVPGGWLVCATPRTLLDDLVAVARSQGVTLVWVGPWWLQGVQRWLSRARQRAGSGVPARLWAGEPGWCLRAEASAEGLSRIWSEPQAGGAVPSPGLGSLGAGAGAGAATTVVDLGRLAPGAGATGPEPPQVWASPEAVALVAGHDRAWWGVA